MPGKVNRHVAGIILAAGSAKRMGQQKLLMPFGKQTIIAATIDNALVNIDPLGLVSGFCTEEVCEIAKAKGIKTVYNPDYLTGQSSSIKKGLELVPNGYAAMFILGDQPLVKPETYRLLSDAYNDSSALIVVPIDKNGKRGNPTIFSPQLFEEISLLSGDIGARHLIEKHRQQVLFVDVDDRGIGIDIDSPEQYAEVAKFESID